MYNYSICYYLLTSSISVSNEIQHFTSFMTCMSRTIRQGPPHVKGAGAVILCFRLEYKTSVICHNVNTQNVKIARADGNCTPKKLNDDSFYGAVSGPR